MFFLPLKDKCIKPFPFVLLCIQVEFIIGYTGRGELTYANVNVILADVAPDQSLLQTHSVQFQVSFDTHTFQQSMEASFKHRYLLCFPAGSRYTSSQKAELCCRTQDRSTCYDSFRWKIAACILRNNPSCVIDFLLPLS